MKTTRKKKPKLDGWRDVLTVTGRARALSGLRERDPAEFERVMEFHRRGGKDAEKTTRRSAATNLRKGRT